jgi:hypothetical protein
MSNGDTPQEVYDNFWSEIVEDGYGCFEPEKIKNELYDYANLITDAGIVYDHVTGGRASKPNTDPYLICTLSDEYVYEQCVSYAEEIYDTVQDMDDINDILQVIKEYANITN